MPLARYFLFVGGVLLALLFVADAVLPKSPAPARVEAAADFPAIRIHSDRKWPKPIVFDTSVAPGAPALTVMAQAPQTAAPTTVAEKAPVTVPDVSAKVRVREAFAQFRPADDPVKVKPRPVQKHKMAKRRVSPPMVLVAQQRPFGFFPSYTR